MIKDMNNKVIDTGDVVRISNTTGKRDDGYYFVLDLSNTYPVFIRLKDDGSFLGTHPQKLNVTWPLEDTPDLYKMTGRTMTRKHWRSPKATIEVVGCVDDETLMDFYFGVTTDLIKVSRDLESAIGLVLNNIKIEL